jgi:predicted 3-demethylubiquinone-9 3-methyltransferase (glyoxalase superfamily)
MARPASPLTAAAYTFNEAISFSVDCDSQEEVDELWEKLTADGGAPGRCGWLKDKFGLSWQIIPKDLGKLLSDPDQGRSQRSLQTMLGMAKVDISQLHQAADQT